MVVELEEFSNRGIGVSSDPMDLTFDSPILTKEVVDWYRHATSYEEIEAFYIRLFGAKSPATHPHSFGFGVVHEDAFPVASTSSRLIDFELLRATEKIRIALGPETYFKLHEVGCGNSYGIDENYSTPFRTIPSYLRYLSEMGRAGPSLCTASDIVPATYYIGASIDLNYSLRLGIEIEHRGSALESICSPTYMDPNTGELRIASMLEGDPQNPDDLHKRVAKDIDLYTPKSKQVMDRFLRPCLDPAVERCFGIADTYHAVNFYALGATSHIRDQHFIFGRHLPPEVYPGTPDEMEALVCSLRSALHPQGIAFLNFDRPDGNIIVSANSHSL